MMERRKPVGRKSLYSPSPRMRKVVAAVCRLDPALARIEAEIGPLKVVRRQASLAGLVETIIGQQISARAADQIRQRLVESCDGCITAAALTKLDDADLRSAGLSSAKLSTIRALAKAELCGELRLSEIGSSTDAEFTASLTRHRGIGPWTAEVFALFALGRADIFPATDLGLQRGYAAFENAPVPTAAELMSIAERWRPYRSGAAVLFWHQYHHATGMI
jgi:DNA-3-methyladenine glycosylase II